MVNVEEIKNRVLSSRDRYIDGVLKSFSDKIDKGHAIVAINRAIDLAIEKTLSEVEK